VVDHIPRQHKIEAAIAERQRVGRSLAHAPRYTADPRAFAHNREAGRTAVDRLDGRPMLGENERVPADAQPRSSAVRAPRAFSSGKSAITSGSGSRQSARPSAVAQRLSQASIAVVNATAITALPHRRLSAPTLT
jgi:hypothetical protein